MRFALCAFFALSASAAVLGGCKPREYLCTRDQECTGSNGGYGKCLSSHCAYPDSTCGSGWKFDDTAGDQSNDCVPPELLMGPDAAVPDAAAGADAGPADAAAADAPAVVPDAGPIDAGTSD